MVFRVPDMTGWSELERAKFYEENSEHFDEIFSGEKATFICNPDTALTERDGIVMTLREAQGYDAKKAWLAKHKEDQAKLVAVPATVVGRELINAP